MSVQESYIIDQFGAEPLYVPPDSQSKVGKAVMAGTSISVEGHAHKDADFDMEAAHFLYPWMTRKEVEDIYAREEERRRIAEAQHGHEKPHRNSKQEPQMRKVGSFTTDLTLLSELE